MTPSFPIADLSRFAQKPVEETGETKGAGETNRVDKQKLEQASKALEEVFAGYLLAEIGKNLPGVGPSMASSIYADFFKNAISHELAERETLGLTKTIYNSIANKHLIDPADIDNKEVSVTPLSNQL